MQVHPTVGVNLPRELAASSTVIRQGCDAQPRGKIRSPANLQPTVWQGGHIDLHFLPPFLISSDRYVISKSLPTTPNVSNV